MTRAEKDAVIKDLRDKIERSQALFLTNLVGIQGTSAVDIRRKVREAKGTVVVTRNTLFRIAAEGTYAEATMKGLKGTNAVAFAFEDAPGVAKALFEASQELEPVRLSKGCLDRKEISATDVVALAKLPSRDQMLGTLLATFNAPVSAFARLINAMKDEVEKQGVSKPAELAVSSAE